MEPQAPSSPGAARLPADASTIRMLVQIMQHMDKRQNATEGHVEELNTRLNNLHSAFQTLIAQLEKKIDMIEAAALKEARKPSQPAPHD